MAKSVIVNKLKSILDLFFENFQKDNIKYNIFTSAQLLSSNETQVEIEKRKEERGKPLPEIIPPPSPPVLLLADSEKLIFTYWFCEWLKSLSGNFLPLLLTKHICSHVWAWQSLLCRSSQLTKLYFAFIFPSFASAEHFFFFRSFWCTCALLLYSPPPVHPRKQTHPTLFFHPLHTPNPLIPLF